MLLRLEPLIYPRLEYNLYMLKGKMAQVAINSSQIELKDRKMSNYESLATGRETSCFKSDIDSNFNELMEAFKGSRVLILGAAGSIGASVVKCLLPYDCSSLTLVDLSENNLVEIIRQLRSDGASNLPKEIDIVPLCIGSLEFENYLKSQKPFDYIMNLSAMKHVRSEKDIFTISRMFKTNVVYLHNLLDKVDYKPKKVFSVSSDKAANPANLMGASKRSMELVLEHHSNRFDVSSARFANVAFSDGSLPYGFFRRIEKGQCISAPDDIRRYFISHQEAGELCVLATGLGKNNDIFYPKLEGKVHEKYFTEIARELLKSKGYRPVEYNSEEEAKAHLVDIREKKEWPCFFSPSGTSGEKAYEEFFTSSEERDESRFENIGAVSNTVSNEVKNSYGDYIQFLDHMIEDTSLTKNMIVEKVQKLIPSLNHIETGKSLNDKM